MIIKIVFDVSSPVNCLQGGLGHLTKVPGQHVESGFSSVFGPFGPGSQLSFMVQHTAARPMFS